MKKLPTPAKVFIALLIGLLLSYLIGALGAWADTRSGNPHATHMMIAPIIAGFFASLYLLGFRAPKKGAGTDASKP